jgi:GNAT superfamily N-acetyltransferase
MNFKLHLHESPDGIEGIFEANENEERIGSCKFNYNTEFEKAYIHDIEVTEGNERKGLGRSLIEKTENHLISKRIKYVNGMAVALKPSTISKDDLKHWWERMGYMIIPSNTNESENYIGHIHKELNPTLKLPISAA